MAANPGTLREAVEKYTVHQFDRSMIQKCLESMDLNYLVDRGGDFVVEFRYDEKIGTELTVFFIAGGEGKQIYVIRIYSSKRIPAHDRERAMTLCNTWNKERRWPKAFLDEEDGTIVLEEQLDLRMGIHQELLEAFTALVIYTAHHFWQWAKEQGL